MVELTILIPAYNEAGSIGSTLAAIQKVCAELDCSHEIIVVDDGSEDATVSESRLEGVRVVCHTHNRGYGAALKTGLREAQGEWVLIIDADLTYPPERIPDLLAARENADMVVGARTGESVKIPLLRRPMKWLLGKLANRVARSPIPDLNSGLRVFRRDMALQYRHLYPDGFSFTSTITLAALCDGYRVEFIPINYAARHGKSKIRPIRDSLNFLVLLIRMAVYFDPLRIFLPTSCAMGILSLLLLVHFFFKDGGLSDAGILACLVTFLIFMMGILADLIVRRSRS